MQIGLRENRTDFVEPFSSLLYLVYVRRIKIQKPLLVLSTLMDCIVDLKFDFLVLVATINGHEIED